MLENPPKAPVDRTVSDAQQLPYCGGITVIATPGHTPGHISLYHAPTRTLIAGDAMVVTDCKLFGPNPQVTLDLDLATKSLRKLTQYDIATVICYHGGLYRGDANKRISAIGSSLERNETVPYWHRSTMKRTPGTLRCLGFLYCFAVKRNTVTIRSHWGRSLAALGESPFHSVGRYPESRHWGCCSCKSSPGTWTS